MRFTTGINRGAGTSLQGYVTAQYSQLVAIFGEPSKDVDGYKVSTEWEITFANGVEATIYDYKDTNLYSDELPTPDAFRAATEQTPYEWHIGGYDKSAVALVLETLKGG